MDLDRVTLVKGWFRDSLNEATKERLKLQKASLIMVDCDIYAATKEVLTFVLPLVRDRAVIIFDDWGWRSDLGEIGQREAYQECIENVEEFKVKRLDGYIPVSYLPSDEGGAEHGPLNRLLGFLNELLGSAGVAVRMNKAEGSGDV